MQVIPNKTTRLLNRLRKRFAVIKAEQNLQTTTLLESKADPCTTDQIPKREKEDLRYERLQKRLMKRISERGKNLPTAIYVPFLAPLPLPKPRVGIMDSIGKIFDNEQTTPQRMYSKGTVSQAIN